MARTAVSDGHCQFAKGFYVYTVDDMYWQIEGSLKDESCNSLITLYTGCHTREKCHVCVMWVNLPSKEFSH